MLRGVTGVLELAPEVLGEQTSGVVGVPFVVEGGLGILVLSGVFTDIASPAAGMTPVLEVVDLLVGAEEDHEVARAVELC